MGIPYCEVQSDNNLSTETKNFIASQRTGIIKKLKSNQIPGASIALLDKKHLLWAAGIGFADGEKPVTPETVFSIQSISKIFIATAVMIEVQDGNLALDCPINEYLPEFTVNSRFEKYPATKITLQHLLTHTAGFTHEAPVGNNFDQLSPSFEAHIESISQTWLKFPVGSKESYSNLGFDLAGYILQRVSKQPLGKYMKEKIFKPFNMTNTTMDTREIESNENKAAGHSRGVKKLQVTVPMLAAGGIYTNVIDLARFVQFHLNQGQVDSHRLLLGIGRIQKHNTYCLGHGGGGFGFLATVLWYPEYGVGAIEMTNSADHHIQGQIANWLLDGIIGKGIISRESRPSFFPGLEQLTDRQPPRQADPLFSPTTFRAEWKALMGVYVAILRGNELTWWAQITVKVKPPFTWKIHRKDDYLYLDNEPLQEHEPLLFFTPSGEALDFRMDPPTWRNIKLKKK